MIASKALSPVQRPSNVVLYPWKKVHEHHKRETITLHVDIFYWRSSLWSVTAVEALPDFQLGTMSTNTMEVEMVGLT